MYRLGWLQTVAAAAALGVLLLCIVAAFLLPKASEFQVAVLRTVVAMSAAAMGYTIPGMVELKVETVSIKLLRLGAAIALFVLAYGLFPNILTR